MAKQEQVTQKVVPPYFYSFGVTVAFSNFIVFSINKPLKVFYKKAVVKNLAIFTGKHLCWSLL